MYHSFFICSSVDRHLCCFHVLAIVNQSCNKHWGTCLFQLWFPQGICLGVRLLGHMVILFIVLKGISTPEGPPFLSSVSPTLPGSDWPRINTDFSFSWGRKIPSYRTTFPNLPCSTGLPVSQCWSTVLTWTSMGTILYSLCSCLLPS